MLILNSIKTLRQITGNLATALPQTGLVRRRVPKCLSLRQTALPLRRTGKMQSRTGWRRRPRRKWRKVEAHTLHCRSPISPATLHFFTHGSNSTITGAHKHCMINLFSDGVCPIWGGILYILSGIHEGHMIPATWARRREDTIGSRNCNQYIPAAMQLIRMLLAHDFQYVLQLFIGRCTRSLHVQCDIVMQSSAPPFGLRYLPRYSSPNRVASRPRFARTLRTDSGPSDAAELDPMSSLESMNPLDFVPCTCECIEVPNYGF